MTSRYFARPISLAISRRLANTGMTPNAMTVISMAIGLAAAPFFLSAAPLWQTVGALLFVLHSVVDGCDGELARLKSWSPASAVFWISGATMSSTLPCSAAWRSAGTWRSAPHGPSIWGPRRCLGPVAPPSRSTGFTLRRKTDDGPVYTSVSQGPSQGLTRVLDDLSRRDFIYLVLALSLFGKASWFLALTAAGAPVFLTLVLVVAVRDARRRRKA